MSVLISENTCDYGLRHKQSKRHRSYILPIPHSNTAPYLAIFEQGSCADIFSLITGGIEMTLLRAL